MLNISKQSVTQEISRKKFSTIEDVENKKSSKVLRRIIYVTFILFLIILFLPWTQNIRSEGTITTLKPDQKPQSLNSIIDGRIAFWYIQEGDFVNKGDTILKISEIKPEYFDSELLNRTQNQVDFKKKSIGIYDDKISTQEELQEVIKTQRNLKLTQSKIKLQQAILKVQNDSIALATAAVDRITADNQLNRMDSLYTLGLKSLTDLEAKRVKLQQTQSYEMEAKNKWLNSQNELITLKIDISGVEAKYLEDYNKLQSDKFTTISGKLDSETNLSKLENTFSNYKFRNGLYYITAPTTGYITKTFNSGIGENIKAGDKILTLMPKNYDLAVELYVRPIDLPLVKKGEKVRIQFDGWPAIIFSGWPNASHGTYGGKIYAIDQFISSNGQFRVLVEPDKEDHPWPEALRFGSGTSTLIMLNDVPIWYELWRNINGFPPEYYKSQNEMKEKTKSTKKSFK
jgi:adhesin transport system membrane fusion protein